MLSDRGNQVLLKYNFDLVNCRNGSVSHETAVFKDQNSAIKEYSQPAFK